MTINYLQADKENMEPLLQHALNQGVQFLQSLPERPTSLQSVNYHAKGLKQSQGAAATLEEFKERFDHLMVASTGPRYWGFVTGGATPAALMGDLLASIYDQNTQTTQGGDLSANIELETIDLLLELFDLPTDQFTGGFVTGATMSNFTCLATARQWLGRQQGVDVAKEGVPGTMNILTAVPHSSAIKSLAMLGLGSKNIVTVGTLSGNREAIDVQELEQQIMQLQGAPFILVSSGGTVNTVDFDDMQAIASLKRKHAFWWHIDAAFGGFARLSPQHHHLLEGWEHADSITIDGHKWLNVPYENAFFFTRKEHSVIQVETFQNSNAPYLGDPEENFNYLNFLPENSRRFKALPAWFTLSAYGKEGYQEIVTRNIHLAQQLGAFIEGQDAFTLLAPVRLNTVCFSLTDPHHDKVHAFLEILNARGKVFMTPTQYLGTAGIRAALVNWRTTQEDLRVVQKELLASYQHLTVR